MFFTQSIVIKGIKKELDLITEFLFCNQSSLFSVGIDIFSVRLLLKLAE